MRADKTLLHKTSRKSFARLEEELVMIVRFIIIGFCNVRQIKIYNCWFAEGTKWNARCNIKIRCLDPCLRSKEEERFKWSSWGSRNSGNDTFFVSLFSEIYDSVFIIHIWNFINMICIFQLSIFRNKWKCTRLSKNLHKNIP